MKRELKQLRVWIKTDKYEAFRKKLAENNQSAHCVINAFVDKYLED